SQTVSRAIATGSAPGGTGTTAGRPPRPAGPPAGPTAGPSSRGAAGAPPPAAVAAAGRLGAGAVTVVARRPAAVEELRPVARAVGVEMRAAAWGDDAATHLGADVVISTVPKGVADPLAVAADWRPETVLFDALYDPWPTPLAASAEAAGCRIVSGLDLLLAQAVGQFEHFTGVTAPRAAMAEALAAARAI
ncbi:shikimate dehydrogenase, partial [Micromonospora echinofusca]|uniref:shikimate dehydrogenase n=1 Tax=Micromonospora echinofusca TaxID=47858 RepID=UPI0033D14EF7